MSIAKALCPLAEPVVVRRIKKDLTSNEVRSLVLIIQHLPVLLPQREFPL